MVLDRKITVQVSMQDTVPIRNEKLFNCILEKFLSPAISNYASYISEIEKPKSNITLKKEALTTEIQKFFLILPSCVDFLP